MARRKAEAADDKDTPGSKAGGPSAMDKVRTRKSGLSHLVDIQVCVDGRLTVREGHDIAHAVKDALIASTAHRISDVTVHVEPVI